MSQPTGGQRHGRQSFTAELLDAVTARTFLLVAGVLVIQLGFVLSYVGAFHQPSLHRAPLAVVDTPARAATALSAELNGLKGHPLHAYPVAGEATGRRLLAEGATSGALVVNPAGTRSTLLVASGDGAALSSAVQTVVSQVEAASHRPLAVVDAVPAQSGDARGLSGFYLVVGWLVGGYLVASLLGVAKGSRPATTRRAVIRLVAVVPYAVLSGLGGALIVGPWLCALTGHFLALWGIGALLVFCACAVTIALQVLLGVIGIGLTVVLFVVLGNPSAGGAYPPPLLPAFWRVISGAIPNGAGVEAVRKVVYFGGQDIAGNLAVIAIYAAAGVIVAVGGACLMARRASPASDGRLAHGRPGPAA